MPNLFTLPTIIALVAFLVLVYVIFWWEQHGPAA